MCIVLVNTSSFFSTKALFVSVLHELARKRTPCGSRMKTKRVEESYLTCPRNLWGFMYITQEKFSVVWLPNL